MNKKKIMYLTFGILTLIITITGSTYAYFALSTNNNNVVTGTTADVGLTLTVTKLKPNTNTTDYYSSTASTILSVPFTHCVRKLSLHLLIVAIGQKRDAGIAALKS